MELQKKTFEVKELGVKYAIPKYKVVNGKLKTLAELVVEGEDAANRSTLFEHITFVRGEVGLDISEDAYGDAISNCKQLIQYPGVWSQSGRFVTKTRLAVKLNDKAKRMKKNAFDMNEDIVLKYENKMEGVDGIRQEDLLDMMIEDLKYKNELAPSNEVGIAIERLKEGLMWLKSR